jgi:serine/threonine-protein kinase
MGKLPLATPIERVRRLFEAALEQPPERRIQVVAEGARGDHALRDEVLALLASHETDDDRLASPVLPGALHEARQASTRWIGARLGAYRIRGRIGEGGMGTVYEAVRADDEYDSRVAIKLLRQSVDDELTIRRFRAERQILANLSHPNIAALLDGGTAPGGWPFIVMEYVDGVPITTWADERRLTVPQRLALFAQVCGAVECAHRNLVVHRDLKPANILVTADGTVKLLDFGIAKLLPDPWEEAAVPAATRVGRRAFTPEYAAPEQFDGRPISAATDVYALGCVLYELLAGRRPLELAGRSFAEMERAVAAHDPPRPSTVLGDERRRALGERTLARARERIAGDLDAIVLTALRKEPERRYGSVEQLARDVWNHLRGFPVSARPDRAGYRLRKLLRRRRVEVAAAAVVALSLVGGIVGTSLQARRAEAESQRAVEVVGFLDAMLSSADPAAYGRDVTVREMLDTAAVRAGALRARPAIETDIRSIIGSTYLALGEYDAAERQFRLELGAHHRAAPRGSHSTAIALTRLAKALEFQGRYDQADSVFGEAWTLLERFPPPTPLSRGIILDNHGRILGHLGRNEEARARFEESLALTLRHDAGNDSSLATSYNNLAVVVANLGDNAAADTLMRRALAAARRRHGDDHAQVASILSAHANVLALLGQAQRADSAYLAAIGMRRRLLGPEHPEIAWTLFNFADHLVRTRRPRQGAGLARQVLAMRGRSLPEEHPGVGVAMQVLGRALGQMDSLPAAERWLRASLEHRRANLPEGHWLIAAGESALGEHLVLARRYAQAERVLLAAEARLVELRGEGTHSVDDTRSRLVRLYTAWDRPADAEAWRRRISPGYPGY